MKRAKQLFPDLIVLPYDFETTKTVPISAIHQN